MHGENLHTTQSMSTLYHTTQPCTWSTDFKMDNAIDLPFKVHGAHAKHGTLKKKHTQIVDKNTDNSQDITLLTLKHVIFIS